jgi:hypothetical protein
MRRSLPRTAALVGITALLSACAGQPSTTPTASVATASPSEAAAPEVADLCAISGVEASEAPAGAYRVDSTTPAMTFTLPEGWTAICDSGTVSLFGPTGILAIIAPVAAVLVGPDQNPVEPTIDAVMAALVAGAAESTEPQPVEIGGATGVEFQVTVDETGVGLRSAAERGWGFANDEFDTGLITLLDVGGSIVGMIRHGDDEAATASDVLASMQFEIE